MVFPRRAEQGRLARPRIALYREVGTKSIACPHPAYDGGYVTVRIAGTVEIRFPITASARLGKGTEAQLKNIEVSPFGLHWPELDEDLSFKGLLNGEF